jgi:hypothetical protein
MEEIPAVPRQKRLLFLHGMFTPPECYTRKLAKQFFDTLAEHGWQVVTVKSPRVCPDQAPDLVFQLFPDLKDQKDALPEWINSQANKDGTKTYQGLEDSLAFLRQYIASQLLPFDAIAGHSNGALMASILTFMMESDPEWLPADKHWKSVVLFNAPGSYKTETQLGPRIHSHGSACKLPSIHVFGGPMDYCWEGQQQLQNDLHPDGKVIIHDSGHFFPSDQKIFDEIAAALN